MMLTIYLNFGGYHGPAYDPVSPIIDIPPAGFPVEDQVEIVARVGKFYEQFNCVVTDQPPVDLRAGRCIECRIGGNEAWSGSTTAQTGFVGGWATPGHNICYVPHLATFSRIPAGVAATIAHEVGHVCGLWHYMKPGSQSEYLRDLPDGNCPIMGAPSDPLKARWHKGTNNLGNYQDDEVILAGILGRKETKDMRVETVTINPRRGLPCCALFAALDRELGLPMAGISGLNQSGSDGSPVGFQVQYTDGGTPGIYNGYTPPDLQVPAGPYAPGGNALGVYVLRLPAEKTTNEGMFIIDAPGMRRVFLNICPVA